MYRTVGPWLLAVVLGLGWAWGLPGPASAQYPPPTGNVAVAAANAAPSLNSTVAVTATVRDQNGSPASGVQCTFGIAQQPGSSASVGAGPFTTDANGNVSTTLQTGSTAGTIVVQATCGGLTAQVSVVAGTAGPGAAAPPASLPRTGGGAEDGGTNWAFWSLIIAGLLVGAGGLSVAWRRAAP